MKRIYFSISGMLFFALAFIFIQGCENSKIREMLDVTENVDYPQIYINSADNSEMVLVPGNRFLMGSPETEPFRHYDETVHEVHMSTFYISKKEITISQYAKFLNSTGANPLLYYNNAMADEDSCGLIRQAGNLFRVVEGKEDFPICHVTYSQAEEYARWANAYLPTEAQWEFAALGGKGHTMYPWGDVLPFTGDEASGGKGLLLNAQKTGSYDLYHNLYDMAGNVSEWCRDNYYDEYYLYSQVSDPLCRHNAYNKVIRGGGILAIGTPADSFRVSARNSMDYRNSSGTVGFRIVQYPQLPDKYL